MRDINWSLLIENDVILAAVAAVFLFVFFQIKKFKAGPSGVEFEVKEEAPRRLFGRRKKEENKEAGGVMGKLRKIETLLEEDAKERVKRQKEVDLRLVEQYEYIKETAAQARETAAQAREAAVAANQGVLWGDKSPPFLEVINGGLTLAMLGQNGNIVARMQECIMGFGGKGVETYMSELNKFTVRHKDKLKDNNHFWQQVKAIKDGIY